MQTLVNVTLPEMGESVSEGSIVEWRKKVGDWVDEGETLVDITTDKVDVEVPSLASGIVAALHGDEGATVAVGAVLAEIDTTAAKPAGSRRAGARRFAGRGEAGRAEPGHARVLRCRRRRDAACRARRHQWGQRGACGAFSRTTPAGWSSGSTSTPPS